MGIVRRLSNNPAIVAVSVAIIVALGVLSIGKLPVQLLPNIERPVLAVQVSWRSASPQEIESEIVVPIERELQGIPGMTQIQSFSNTASAYIMLEFSLGTDTDQAFTEVSSRLQRVRTLPAEADRPIILRNGGGPATDMLIFLFLQRLPDSVVSTNDLREFARERIAPRIESVEGVGSVNVLEIVGEQAIQVNVDPYAAAQLGVTLDQIANNINRSSDVSGGSMEVGRREYTLRFEGRYSLEKLENTILEWRGDAPITLGSIATVTLAPTDTTSIVYQNGNQALGIQVMREPGTNTLAAINGVKERLDELNDGLLSEYGLQIEKSFDPSVFIERAVSLLSGNLLIGIILAVSSLWLFIRNFRATLIIAVSIPICLMATVFVLNLFGRTINVISLAGLAFATGMVLDAAIVVLENFVRLREQGDNAKTACVKAVEQVSGALFASTITTVVIFIPIVFFEDVEGQLFADLALTIAIAVFVSFFVAILVLPVAARLFLNAPKGSQSPHNRFWRQLPQGIMRLTATARRRFAAITLLIVGPALLSWMLWPQLNYLPPVKRDAVDGFISFPSGASKNLVREEVAEVIVDRLDPYMRGEKQPALRNYYLFTGPWGGQIGVRILDQSRIDEMVGIVNGEILSGFPDVRGFAQQGNLFGGFGGNASVSVELQSEDFAGLNEGAIQAQQIIQEAFPGARIMPNPDPQVVMPELRLIPNDRRIAEVRMTRDSVARAIRALGDGLWLGEFFHDGGRVDVLLTSSELSEPNALMRVPIATPAGVVVPLGDLTSIERSVGPNQIYRHDTRRTISLNINPPDGMALGTIVEKLKADVEDDLYAVLPPGSAILYSGKADSLNRAIGNLGGNFLLAAGLLFLVMAALFKSLKDSFVVIVSLPMAAVGGVIAIRAIDVIAPTPLDLLGMIGFIILLGLVVNNAILLVVETRRGEAEGLDRRAAVQRALEVRIRPIFMSTTTSIMGMLPLVVAPGAGSLIYKGLATVIVGGMTVSTIFTLILLPSLLQLGGAKSLQPTETLPSGERVHEPV